MLYWWRMQRKTLRLAIGATIVLLLIGLIIDNRPGRNADRINNRETTDMSLPEEAIEPREGFDGIGVTEYSYGDHALEKLDVYTTPYLADAPIIVMLHGGGWVKGDKANKTVYGNKVDYWVPQGYIFVSVNIPLIVDEPNLDQQMSSLANAVAYVQKQAANWGGDPEKIILMGHSAGGHIVAAVSANQKAYPELAPWRGTVLLDSGALDVVSALENKPSDILTNAFGTDPSGWLRYSPLALLTTAPLEPSFVVCSSLRAQSHCADAERYVDKITSLGGQAILYPVALNHADINRELGLESDYTTAVNDFIVDVLR